MADAAVQVVLVPGFWLGGWAWDDVIEPLRDAGLVPHAVTLPGLTPDAADRGAVTRADHVDAVRALVATLDGPVVLVGHSGGGALVGEVLDRDPDRYARVVFVDSGPLVDGARLAPALPPGVTEIALPEWDELEAQGSSLAGLDGASLARFRERAVPQPALVATGMVRMRDPARLEVPVTVVCTSISADQFRTLASHDAPFHTELLDYADVSWVDLPTGHWPMLSRPADLAAVLVGACET
jgi:pimeloyl-ACP methyl ester carboxylesterase